MQTSIFLYKLAVDCRFLCNYALAIRKQTGHEQKINYHHSTTKSLYSIVHYVINNDSVNSYFQAFANVYLQNDTCMMWQYLNKAGFVAGAESEDDNDHEIQYDRNVKWIPVIKKNIADASCMVAVGCRHLMGSESLIAMLRREGYTVEPVKKK